MLMNDFELTMPNLYQSIHRQRYTAASKVDRQVVTHAVIHISLN